MKKRFVTTGEVAKICEVTSKTVIAWIERKHLKSFRIGKGPRKVKIADLFDFLVEKDFPIDSVEELHHMLYDLESKMTSISI